MATRAKRPCNYPGCHKLVDNGYCAEHKKHDRKRTRTKSAEHQKLYDSRWKRESKAFIKANPFCQCDECKRLNRLMQSEVTDHHIPHKGDIKLFWDRSNWRALNKRCHDRKTAREDGGFGNDVNG